MISEIRASVVGVSDLTTSVAFYRSCFDYAVLGEGSISAEETTHLLGGDEKQTGREVLLGVEGVASGRLRLVEFDTPGELYWGDYAHLEDYGHYALNVRVPDINEAVAAINEHGGRTRSGPTHWTVMPDLSAWDSLSFDPDGVLLDVFELQAGPSNPLADFDGRPTALQTVAIHSSDARAAARFYAALGLRPMYDKLLEEMEEFFAIPQGTGLHNINMMNPSAPGLGRLEIAQYVGFPGRSQRDRAVAGAHGILSVAFETDDLDATDLLLTAIGAETTGDRITVDRPGLGTVTTRGYFGPDGERLEFYQIL